jgi:signal transduction histidine kinase
MELIAGLIGGWVVLYLATGAYLVRRWLTDGRQRVYLLLAGTSFALAAYSAVSAVFHLADTAAVGGACTRIQTALATGGVVPMLFSFALDFADWQGRRARWARWTVSVLGLALAGMIAAGLAFDPSQPVVRHVALPGLEGTYHEYAPAPAGVLFVVFDLAVILASTVIVGRSALRNRVTARPVALGVALFLAGSLNDALVLTGVYEFLYLGEHAYLLLLASFGYTLLERSARLAQDLRERTTQLQAAHRELEEVHASLRRSYDSLHETQKELHETERLADLGRMAASLAHEIRNPLCVLSNVAAGLRRQLDRDGALPDQHTMLDALQDEVRHLDRLVDDLLAFARPDRRSRARVSLAMVADQAILAVVSGLPEPGRYDVRRQYADPPPKAMLDLDRVRRALVNLVLNACQAMPTGGPLTVIVERQPRPGSVRIGVRDVGDGIAPDDRGRIFTPFFSTKPSGTGLGLPIVRSIAQDHDGRVEVESEPGRGSTFWLYLYSESGDPETGPAAGPTAPEPTTAPV